MVEAEFPTIVWTPCACHCLDLLFEDIGRLPWVAPILSDARRICSFFRKKHQALAIFRSHSQVDMIRPAGTRFAYIYLVFSRLQRVMMRNSESWMHCACLSLIGDGAACTMRKVSQCATFSAKGADDIADSGPEGDTHYLAHSRHGGLHIGLGVPSMDEDESIFG